MKRFLSGMLVVLMAALYGCGGGDSAGNAASQNISGVAAAGAPLVGFAYLKDGKGVTRGPAEIGRDGSFSFDVTGLTAPFMLEARGSAAGQSFTLDSMTTTSGTANINPLSNLVAAQALGGQNPTDVFNSATPANFNQASVDAAIAALRITLAPLLAAANVADSTNLQSFDPIKVSYVADPSKNKLDAMFDAVNISVAAATVGTPVMVSITDKSGNVIMPPSPATTTGVSGAASAIASASTSIAAIPHIATDSASINQFLQSWANAVISKGANLTVADVDTFFIGSASNTASYGLQNGYNRTDWIASSVGGTITALQVHGQLVSINNFAIRGDVTGQGTYLDSTGNPLYHKVYQVYYETVRQDGTRGSGGNSTVVQQVQNGPWSYIGNGFKISFSINPYAAQFLNADGTTVHRNGLSIILNDFGNLNVNSVSLEGPGLPSGGLTLSKSSNGPGSLTRLALDPVFKGYPAGDSAGQYEMTDTGTAQMAPATPNAYTLKLYSSPFAPADHSTGLIQTLYPLLTSRPLLGAQVSPSMFGSFTISGVTHQLSSLLALPATVTVQYTKPTGYVPASGFFYLHTWNGQNIASENNQMTQQLNLSNSSITVIISTLFSGSLPITNGGLRLHFIDFTGQQFDTYYSFSLK